MATRVRVTRTDMLAKGQSEAASFKPVTVPRDAALAQRARTAMTRNVTNVYRDAPAATVEQGRTWYPKAHEEAATLGRALGAGTKTGAGIIAAVSPSMSWENNIPAAHQFGALPEHHVVAMSAANEVQKRLATQIGMHERAAAKAAGMKGTTARITGAAPAHLYAQHEQATRDHMASRAVLRGTPLNNQSTDNIVKAARIRSGEAPEHVLPQRLKTGNFYRNVNDPGDAHAVTVDTHAHDAARGVKLPFKTDRGLTAVGRYDHFAGAYRNAAQRVGETHGHVVQATVWQHWKNTYGVDTTGAAKASARPSYMDEEPEGHDRDKAERAIAARSAATTRKRGRVVDPQAAAQGW